MSNFNFNVNININKNDKNKAGKHKSYHRSYHKLILFHLHTDTVYIVLCA